MYVHLSSKIFFFQLTLLISTPGKSSWADEYEDEEG